MSGDPRLTRRAVLLGTLALPLAACRHRSPRGGSVRSPVPAAAGDLEALREAYAAEARIVAAYDVIFDSMDDNGALGYTDEARAEHHAHLDALRSLLQAPLPTSTPAGPLPGPGPELRHAVVSTGPMLQRHAIGVTAGEVAALLASIAAAHLDAPSEPNTTVGATWYGSASS